MTISTTVRDRARLSARTSADPNYRTLVEILTTGDTTRDGFLLDFECVAGALWSFVRSYFSRFVGADAVAYEGFPADDVLPLLDLDIVRVPLLISARQKIAEV